MHWPESIRFGQLKIKLVQINTVDTVYHKGRIMWRGF